MEVKEVRLPSPVEIPAEVQKLVAERELARKDKDFARSDALRTEIELKGYEIKDSPDGPSAVGDAPDLRVREVPGMIIQAPGIGMGGEDHSSVA